MISVPVLSKNTVLLYFVASPTYDDLKNNFDKSNPNCSFKYFTDSFDKCKVHSSTTANAHKVFLFTVFR